MVYLLVMFSRERKRREQERKLGQIRANPVVPVQPHNNGGPMPPAHFQASLASVPPPQPYLPPQPQPLPSRPEKLASLPRSVVAPPSSAPNPGGETLQLFFFLIRMHLFLCRLCLDYYLVDFRHGHCDQGTTAAAAASDHREARPAVHHHQ